MPTRINNQWSIDGLEDKLLVVINFVLLQELDVFLAKCSAGVVLFLVFDILMKFLLVSLLNQILPSFDRENDLEIDL